MHREPKTGFTARLKEVHEFGRRVAHLRAAHANAEQPVSPWTELVQQRERIRFGAVALRGDNQSNADAVFTCRSFSGREGSVKDGRDGNTAGREALRSDENFGTDDVVFVRLPQIGAREIVKILLGDQDLATSVVEIQKRLKIRKLVRRA